MPPTSVALSEVYVGPYAETDVTSIAATTTGYTRATGSFVDDGFVVGMQITPSGFSANTVTTVEVVAALTLTTSARTAEAAEGGRDLIGVGPFALLEDMTSWEGTHGEESDTTTYVFGRTRPYVTGGDDTDEYRLSGLYNTGDAGGQDVIRDSRDNREFFAMRIYPAGTSAKAYQQPVKCTQYVEGAERSGEYVSCSFAARGVGTRTYSSDAGVFAG
jgi:hypothetical protein